MTLELLQSRHSVRAYSTTPLSEDIKKKLAAEITYINTHATGLRFQIVFDNNDPFSSFRKSYGMFRGVRNYVAMIADYNYDGYKERAGYYGQQFVMKAVELGLGTCFVGATFDTSSVEKNVQRRVYEHLVCLITFGIPEVERTSFIGRMAAKMSHRKSLAPNEFYQPLPGGLSLQEALKKVPDLKTGLEAMACAPSAMNRQPPRVSMDKEGVLKMYVKSDSGYNLIDLGIAEYNFESVASGLLILDKI